RHQAADICARYERGGLGPAIKRSGGSALPWEEPIPLAADDTVPAFPSECYPPALRLLVEQGSDALDCPPDFIGVPLLAIGGAALAASRALGVTETHLQTGRIFAGVIGRTGSAKSPALDLVAAPVYERQSVLLRDWESKMEDYQRQAAAHESAKKAQKRSKEK